VRIIQRVQRKLTRMVSAMRGFSQKVGLEKLGLIFLEHSKLRGRSDRGGQDYGRCGSGGQRKAVPTR